MLTQKDSNWSIEKNEFQSHKWVSFVIAFDWKTFEKQIYKWHFINEQHFEFKISGATCQYRTNFMLLINDCGILFHSFSKKCKTPRTCIKRIHYSDSFNATSVYMKRERVSERNTHTHMFWRQKFRRLEAAVLHTHIKCKKVLTNE